MQINNRTRGILLAAGFLFVLFLVWYFSSIVTYILLSVVLSFMGKPLVNRLVLVKYKKFRISKGVAAMITLLVIWVVFISFFTFTIPLLIKELNTFSEIDFTLVIDSIGDPIIQFLNSVKPGSVELKEQSFFEVVAQSVGNKIDFSKLSDLVSVLVNALAELLIGFFSVSFITFFFLKEENMFREMVILLVPSNIETKVAHILDSISALLRRYFIGLILEVFMVMLLVTFGLSIVGLAFNHAVIIGLFCGFLNVIPYLGPWMGAILGLLIGASLNIDSDFMSHTLPLLGFMTIVFATVQLIDNILFQPLIYSKSVKAHPLEIFIVILAAGSMAGIIGMILAIPVYTILRVIAREFFENMKIVKKITENLDKNNEPKKFLIRSGKNVGKKPTDANPEADTNIKSGD